MQALTFHGGVVRLADRPVPIPAPGEALLKIHRAGICATDLEIARGYMGFEGTLGHEAVGEVVDVGPGTALPAGLDGVRVVPSINFACQRCAICRAGDGGHCPERTVLGILGQDGAMAEYVTAPIANLHAVPAGVDADRAVFTEPLAAAIHAFDGLALDAHSRVLVLGDGKLGLLIGLALASRAPTIGQAVLVGRHPEKLAIAAATGLDTALAADFDGGGFDVVVEATGHPDGLATAFAALRPRGTLVLKSTYAAGTPNLAPIVINELRVVGSRCGPFEPALAALARGTIDPRPLIQERFALADGEAAFARAGEKGVLKVLLEV